jgi:hypothetical protein
MCTKRSVCAAAAVRKCCVQCVPVLELALMLHYVLSTTATTATTASTVMQGHADVPLLVRYWSQNCLLPTIGAAEQPTTVQYCPTYGFDLCHTKKLVRHDNRVK